MTRGSILFKGIDLVSAEDIKLRALRGRAISIMFQDPLSALNPLTTIGDQIAEVMEAHERGDEAIGRMLVRLYLQAVGTASGLPNCFGVSLRTMSYFHYSRRWSLPPGVTALGHGAPLIRRRSMFLYNSTCSEMAKASSTSIPRYRTVLSSLVCSKSNCTARMLPVFL